MHCTENAISPVTQEPDVCADTEILSTKGSHTGCRSGPDWAEVKARICWVSAGSYGREQGVLLTCLD
jgi:hypothetical protein